MPLTCPECGGKRPRLSKSRGFKEELLRFFGVYPVRCEDCGARFSDSVWRFSEVIYARCPRCYRMDLGVWDARYYSPSLPARIKMAFGGKRFRCEACRCNFVTFRLMKERSTFRKRIVNHPAPNPALSQTAGAGDPALRDSGNGESPDRIQVA